MRRRLLSILVLSLLAASTLAGCGSSPSALTILSITEGDVSVMKAGTDDWIEAEVETRLGVGDIIRIGDDSGAEITFFDGSTLELEAGTQVEITALDVSPDTDVTAITLMQTIGTTIFRVTKFLDPASRYEVETPTGVVAVRGSAAETHVTEDGITWTCNLEGDVWAAGQDVELQIPEGRCCIVRPGQPPELAWKLAISSTTGGGVTIPGEGDFAYEEGAVVELVAEAEEGYIFVNWTGDVATIADINAAATTITVDAACSITANFVRGYTLTVSSREGGWVWGPGEGQFAYADGTVVELGAVAESSWRFFGWSGDVDTVADVHAAETTIVMNGDYSVTAIFERQHYLY
jgi:hypothetical protein